MASNEHNSVPNNDALAFLGPNSYTAQRLQHATAEHLHLTTRRAFIGPIPEGWLKSHRRDWYKRHLHINYSSRAATFQAPSNVDHTRRRMTGIDGPSITAAYGHSFPQPEELDGEEGGDDEDDAEDDEVVKGIEPENQEHRRLSIPRIGTDSSHTKARGSVTERERITEDDGEDFIDDPQLQRIHSSHATNRRPTFDLGSAAASGPSRTSLDRPRTGQTDVSSRKSLKTFVTASEGLDGTKDKQRDSGESLEPSRSQSQQGLSPVIGSDPGTIGVETDTSSNVSLLRDGEGKLNSDQEAIEADDEPGGPKSLLDPKDLPGTVQPKGLLKKIKSRLSTESLRSQRPDGENTSGGADGRSARVGRVQFALTAADKEMHVKQRLAQVKRRGTIRRIKRNKIHDGEIVKMEKMLVRVEFTTYELPNEYGENESQKVETRVIDKWKEYMVVCRGSSDDDMEFALQLYRTRVIPAIEHVRIKKNSTHSIPLIRTTKINLYSSLDKTMVLWKPWKNGTLIYVMKPHSSADSMEWYTFLRNIMGWSRPSVLQINVPGIDMSLRLKNPFKSIESARSLAQAAEGDYEAVTKTMQEEEAVAANIISRCLDMLNKSPDSKELVEDWAQGLRIGLAWKRFDRLEWVYGVNERRMYGTMGMEKSHDLELRPKQHYPTQVKNKKGNNSTEPPPVEGFLIRLTSQKGNDQRLGRLFFKRLYFSTHNQWLIFNRPARADPPPPPSFLSYEGTHVPSAHQISDKIPLIYSVNPFPITDGEVDWLRANSELADQRLVQCDQEAQDEVQRTTNVLMKCDGIFDMTHINKVRQVKRGATPADENLEEGSDVDFNQEVDDTLHDDGEIKDFDDDRTFELVLKNRMVIRLQAYDIKTKDEWMKRLRALVKYWKRRRAEEIGLYMEVRKTNQERLQVDEQSEALLGQYAQKWEVTKSVASPLLYHVCGIAHCRSVHLSGLLYRKTRIHAGFERCLVILSHGCLLVFRDALRSRSGKIVPSIHHERVGSLDLRDCYVYSGLLTESELGNPATRGVNFARPDRRGLPRMYTEDGWSSIDEDTMTSFVIWHGKRRTWFRSERGVDEERRAMLNDQGKIKGRTTSGGMLGKKHGGVKLVTRLGVTGNHMVFKTRSRAERDHWVMSVGMEIERLGTQDEGVRLTGQTKDP